MSTTVERIEADVRELLGRLDTSHEGPIGFECPCKLAHRIGALSVRDTFEGLAQLWIAGKAEHVNGRWRATTRSEEGETR